MSLEQTVIYNFRKELTPMSMGPILLEPNYISPIWAGPRISQIRGLPYGGDVNNGESFDVSAHRGMVGTVLNTEHAGMKFDQLIRENHDEVIGSLADDATVQVCYMDAIDNLSVQVHPDEEYATRVEDDHEKAEAWYILDAEPGATLIAGCTTNDLDALRKAADDDTIGDAYGLHLPVSEGDFVLVPAGTMHAVGPGILCVEVGTLGFTTYRLCDWGRGRELAVDKGFDVLKTENVATVTHLGLYDSSVAAGSEALVRRGFTHALCAANVIDVHGEWTEEMGDRYQVLTIVKGEAMVATPNGEVMLTYTRSAVIPACAGSFTVRGNCRVIQSFVPEA